MTEDELTRLEALANAATPGPWTVDEGSYGHDYDVAPLVGGVFDGMFFDEADAAFIAAARTAVPELIAEVRRMRRMLAKCKPYLEHSSGVFNVIQCRCDDDIMAATAGDDAVDTCGR